MVSRDCIKSAMRNGKMIILCGIVMARNQMMIKSIRLRK